MEAVVGPVRARAASGPDFRPDTLGILGLLNRQVATFGGYSYESRPGATASARAGASAAHLDPRTRPRRIRTLRRSRDWSRRLAPRGPAPVLTVPVAPGAPTELLLYSSRPVGSRRRLANLLHVVTFPMT